MPKKLVKILTKIAAVGLTSVGAYHAYYQRKHPLILDAPDEFLLEPSNDELRNQTLNFDWVSEANYTQEMNEKVCPYLSERMVKGQLKRGDYTLAYEKYGLDDAVATVALVHGFNEYKEKYTEMVYYLVQNKMQVVIYDQRGHGESKLTAQQTQIDSQNFNEYVLDLKAIIDEVARPLVADQHKLVIFSHSMGGAITTSYIEQFPNDVDGAILNAPMFMIDTGKYPQSLTYLYSKTMSKVGYGRNYIPTTEAFDPDLHTIYDDDPEDAISNSQIREAYFHKVNLSLHSVPTQGGSLNWLKTAFDTTHAILKPERLSQVKIPILLFRAGNDTIVEKEGVFTAGHYLPNVERILISDSKHQTYLDHDKALKIYVQKLIQFIRSV